MVDNRDLDELQDIEDGAYLEATSVVQLSPEEQRHWTTIFAFDLATRVNAEARRIEHFRQYIVTRWVEQMWNFHQETKCSINRSRWVEPSAEDFATLLRWKKENADFSLQTRKIEEVFGNKCNNHLRKAEELLEIWQGKPYQYFNGSVISPVSTDYCRKKAGHIAIEENCTLYSSLIAAWEEHSTALLEIKNKFWEEPREKLQKQIINLRNEVFNFPLGPGETKKEALVYYNSEARIRKPAPISVLPSWGPHTDGCECSDCKNMRKEFQTVLSQFQPGKIVQRKSYEDGSFLMTIAYPLERRFKKELARLEDELEVWENPEWKHYSTEVKRLKHQLSRMIVQADKTIDSDRMWMNVEFLEQYHEELVDFGVSGVTDSELRKAFVIWGKYNCLWVQQQNEFDFNLNENWYRSVEIFQHDFGELFYALTAEIQQEKDKKEKDSNNAS